MSTHRDNPAFGHLCDAVAYRRLVVVTGSGVSAALARHPPGAAPLPTWYSVLTMLQARFAHLLQPVEKELELLLDVKTAASDYLIEAATLIRETVGVARYREAVVELTAAPAGAHSALHDLIEDLDPLGIITFNYDMGHENAYRHRHGPGAARLQRAIYSDERKLRAVLAGDFGSRFVLKAHGCISRPDTIVLDRASYREIMARQLGYRAFAHHVLARFSALIVGFGLSDPDFEDLLQSFEANFGGGIGHHVYIWKRGQRADEQARALLLRRRYGLACIFVDDFDEVRTVIADARANPGPRLRHAIAAALKRTEDVAQFRHHRRAAHVALAGLSAAGAKVAGDALKACVNDRERSDLVRAEAAYSIGKLRPTPVGSAEFLLSRVTADAPSAIASSALAALLQLDPPVDLAMVHWMQAAQGLGSVCDALDRRSAAEATGVQMPRARKYLDALLARWEATRAWGEGTPAVDPIEQ
ncbi:MAG: SIR2 family protein [Gammaproteobacteria bacterium]